MMNLCGATSSTEAIFIIICTFAPFRLFRANRAPNTALCAAVHAWCRFLHGAIFAAAIGCVGVILSSAPIH